MRRDFFVPKTPVERRSPSGIALRPSPKNGPPDRFINGSAVQKEINEIFVFIGYN